MKKKMKRDNIVRKEAVVSIKIYEPPYEKTNNMHMRKQRRRSASR